MRDLILQDWLSLFHASGTGPIVQSESAYLDTSAYQDVVAWIEFRGVTPSNITLGNPLTVLVETAPIKEEAFFKTICELDIFGNPPSPGVSTAKATLRSLPLLSTPPVCAWTRWKVSEFSNAYDWSLTFRIWLAVNSACM